MHLTDLTPEMLKAVHLANEDVLFFSPEGVKFILNSIRLDTASGLLRYRYGRDLSGKSIGFCTQQDARNCVVSLKYIFSSVFRE